MFRPGLDSRYRLGERAGDPLRGRAAAAGTGRATGGSRPRRRRVVVQPPGRRPWRRARRGDDRRARRRSGSGRMRRSSTPRVDGRRRPPVTRSKHLVLVTRGSSVLAGHRRALPRRARAVALRWRRREPGAGSGTSEPSRRSMRQRASARTARRPRPALAPPIRARPSATPATWSGGLTQPRPRPERLTLTRDWRHDTRGSRGRSASRCLAQQT